MAALNDIPRQPEVYEKIDAIRAAADSEQSDRDCLMLLNSKLQRITELYIEGDLDKATYTCRCGDRDRKIAGSHFGQNPI